MPVNDAKIEKLIKTNELLISRLDTLTTELKMLINILMKGISEVEDEIVDPLFEGIDDPMARQVLKYIIKVAESGRTVILENEISKELGIPPNKVASIIEYLTNKGYKIKVIVGENEQTNKKENED